MRRADGKVSGRQVSATEAAVVGLESGADIDVWVAGALHGLLAERVREVVFRAGRIEAVYGLVTDTGREVVLKVHRAPVDLDARRLVARAQELLAASGFPCARPLAGPSVVQGRVVSVESLLPEGEPADAHDPRIRRVIAEGLAEQVAILSAHRRRHVRRRDRDRPARPAGGGRVPPGLRTSPASPLQPRGAESRGSRRTVEHRILRPVRCDQRPGSTTATPLRSGAASRPAQRVRRPRLVRRRSRRPQRPSTGVGRSLIPATRRPDHPPRS